MGYLRNEWRRFPRVIPEDGTPLDLVVEQPAGMLGAVVRDLGEGGMELQLVAVKPGWLGQPVSLRLTLPREPSLRVRGRVGHIESDRIGIVFEEVAAGDRAVIRRYIERVAREGWWSRLRRMMQP